LAGLEAAIGLVDDVDPALPADEAVAAVARAEGAEGIADLHGADRGYLTKPAPDDRRLGELPRKIWSSGRQVKAAQRFRAVVDWTL
jgi:hypothetical protein